LAARALRQLVSRAAALRLIGLRFFAFFIALHLTFRHYRLLGLCARTPDAERVEPGLAAFRRARQKANGYVSKMCMRSFASSLRAPRSNSLFENFGRLGGRLSFGRERHLRAIVDLCRSEKRRMERPLRKASGSTLTVN
jgi:hypothetical protein